MINALHGITLLLTDIASAVISIDSAEKGICQRQFIPVVLDNKWQRAAQKVELKPQQSPHQNMGSSHLAGPSWQERQLIPGAAFSVKQSG